VPPIACVLPRSKRWRGWRFFCANGLDSPPPQHRVLTRNKCTEADRLGVRHDDTPSVVLGAFRAAQARRELLSGTPVATVLRAARTPKGTEVRTVIKHVTKRLRTHWPNTSCGAATVITVASRPRSGRRTTASIIFRPRWQYDARWLPLQYAAVQMASPNNVLARNSKTTPCEVAYRRTDAI
jgi:hypothetical protein